MNIHPKSQNNLYKIKKNIKELSEDFSIINSEEFVNSINDADPATPSNVHKTLEQQIQDNKKLNKRLNLGLYNSVAEQNAYEPITVTQNSAPVIDFQNALEKSYKMSSFKDNLFKLSNNKYIISFMTCANFFDRIGEYEYSDKIFNLLK